MKLFLGIITSMTFCAFAWSQQQPQYSMYLNNGLVLNPANAGSKKHVTSALFYRQQWSGFNGAPQTSSLLIHGPSRNQKHGFGFSMNYDKISAWRSYNLNVNYALHFPFGKKGDLAFGAAAGLNQVSSDMASLHYNGASDPAVATTAVSSLRPRISLGAQFRVNTFRVGLAVVNPIEMASNDPGVQDEVRHINSIAAVAIPFTDDFEFEPSVLLQIARSAAVKLDVNAMFHYKKRFTVGAGFRMTGDLIMLAQVQLSRQLRFGYAYDLDMRPGGTSLGGTHELMLIFDFRFIKHGVDSMRYF